VLCPLHEETVERGVSERLPCDHDVRGLVEIESRHGGKRERRDMVWDTSVGLVNANGKREREVERDARHAYACIRSLSMSGLWWRHCCLSRFSLFPTASGNSAIARSNFPCPMIFVHDLQAFLCFFLFTPTQLFSPVPASLPSLPTMTGFQRYAFSRLPNLSRPLLTPPLSKLSGRTYRHLLPLTTRHSYGGASLLIRRAPLELTSHRLFSSQKSAAIAPGTSKQPTYIEQALKGANQGDAKSQHILGIMYFEGHGVVQDYSKAFEWFSKAAHQGYATSQFNVGTMYRLGQGTPMDESKAAEWYLKAAQQGDSQAQSNVGNMYCYGKGVPQDYTKAMEWYLKAAEQGCANAQCNIAHMYNIGEGVPEDDFKAAEWYMKAAPQGHESAQYHLGLQYTHGRGVPQDYTKAREWYLKAAQQGNADAQCNLGSLYYNGESVPRDYTIAMEWCLKAANQGLPMAQFNVGNMYKNGIGVSRDDSKAMEWYLKAASQGHVDAQIEVSKM